MYGFGGVGLSEVQNSISELSVVGGWVGGGGLDKRTSWSDLVGVRQKMEDKQPPSPPHCQHHICHLVIVLALFLISYHPPCQHNQPRYRAPRRAAYLGSGSLVALGGASLGCYRLKLILRLTVDHPHKSHKRLFAYKLKVHLILTSLILHSWIAPSLASYPWTNYLPLFSVILMYTGDLCFIFGGVFLILIS